jgi:hypothetical protein
VFFIRADNAVGAQGAQCSHINEVHKQRGSSNCGGLTCADGVPSARIVD